MNLEVPFSIALLKLVENAGICNGCKLVRVNIKHGYIRVHCSIMYFVPTDIHKNTGIMCIKYDAWGSLPTYM